MDMMACTFLPERRVWQVAPITFSAEEMKRCRPFILGSGSRTSDGDGGGEGGLSNPLVHNGFTIWLQI